MQSALLSAVTYLTFVTIFEKEGVVMWTMCVVFLCFLVVGGCGAKKTDVFTPDNVKFVNEREGCQLGGFEGEVKDISFAELFTDRHKYEGRRVRVSGIVDSLCPEGGCWIDIASSKGLQTSVDNILVSSLDKKFKFPVDAVGSEVVVTGIYHHKLFRGNKLIHFQEHGWRKELKVEGDMKIDFIEAEKVLFKGDRVCRQWVNKVEVENMEEREMNFHNMGAGLVCLEKGESMKFHSTGRHQEIMTVVSGKVILLIDRGWALEQIKLPRFHSAHIPEATLHSVKNTSDSTSCYIYVHGRIMKEEEEHHEHHRVK